MYFETKGNPEWGNYNKIQIKNFDEVKRRYANGEWQHLAYCEGCWNNYIKPCNIERMEKTYKWAALCDWYVHKDGHNLLVKGYSGADMW